jgi:hypothetical protein
LASVAWEVVDGVVDVSPEEGVVEVVDVSPEAGVVEVFPDVPVSVPEVVVVPSGAV